MTAQDKLGHYTKASKDSTLTCTSCGKQLADKKVYIVQPDQQILAHCRECEKNRQAAQKL